MAIFLFKTEPKDYSFEDLVREKKVVWEGVSAPAALKYLRTVKTGDTVAIYHTGDVKAVVGLARATSDSYPDAMLNNPKRAVVDIEPVGPLAKPVALSTFRVDPVLMTSELVRLPRLSVMPLTAEHLERIEQLAKS